jgi:hypothetical protein
MPSGSRSQGQVRDMSKHSTTPAAKAALRHYKTHGADNLPIAAETARLWRLLAKMPSTLSGAPLAHRIVKQHPAPTVTVHFRSARIDDAGNLHTTANRGWATYATREISLGAGASWQLLAHEIIHCAGFRGHDRAFYMALRWLTEARWKMTLNFCTVTKYGYAVDRLIESQIKDITSTAFKVTA